MPFAGNECVREQQAFSEVDDSFDRLLPSVSRVQDPREAMARREEGEPCVSRADEKDIGSEVWHLGGFGVSAKARCLAVARETRPFPETGSFFRLKAGLRAVHGLVLRPLSIMSFQTRFQDFSLLERKGRSQFE